PLGLAQTQIDETILCAVNGLQDSGDDAGVAWSHSVSNSPAVAPSGLSADQPFAVVFRKFSVNAPSALERKNVGIDADINRLCPVFAIDGSHENRRGGGHGRHGANFLEIALLQITRPGGAVQSDGSRVIRTAFGHNQNVGAEPIQFVADTRAISILKCKQAEQGGSGDADANGRYPGAQWPPLPFFRRELKPVHRITRPSTPPPGAN